eukprot:gb/GECG01008796.1/.p1 GENE.gb/GECG01008796.1/~~gb/GECG01008796.1/.p1  ORF type:complete len:120 (+),score=30.04 gb/GECG01008796.1/:1-360(+)
METEQGKEVMEEGKGDEKWEEGFANAPDDASSSESESDAWSDEVEEQDDELSKWGFHFVGNNPETQKQETAWKKLQRNAGFVQSIADQQAREYPSSLSTTCVTLWEEKNSLGRCCASRR